jgi:hypothetical protein
MANEDKGQRASEGMPAAGTEQRSLEARVAELEDRVAKIHITEEELRAYHKFSALMAGGGAAAPAQMGAQQAAACVVDCVGGCISECAVIRNCTIVRNCTIIRNCTIVRNCTIIQQCINECGPGLPGGGGFGGGFGSLGG